MPCNRRTFLFYHGTEFLTEAIAHSKAEAVDRIERQQRILDPGGQTVAGNIRGYLPYLTVKELPCGLPCPTHK